MPPVRKKALKLKGKTGPKQSAGGASEPATDDVPALPDRVTLATLASRLITDDGGTEKAVSTAWRLLKAADRLIRTQIPKEIRIERERLENQRLQASKGAVKTIRDITNQSRKDRALEYFREFLKGGRNKSTGIDFKTFDSYLADGITSEEKEILTAAYRKAFPNRKKREREAPQPQPRNLISWGRKIDISADPDEASRGAKTAPSTKRKK